MHQGSEIGFKALYFCLLVTSRIIIYHVRYATWVHILCRILRDYHVICQILRILRISVILIFFVSMVLKDFNPIVFFGNFIVTL